MKSPHEKALGKGKWNSTEKRYNKSYEAGMKSYNANAKHNPKTGFLELKRNAPKRAKAYQASL